MSSLPITRSLLTLLLLGIAHSHSLLANPQWTGTTSSNMNTAANWNPAAVPTGLDCDFNNTATTFTPTLTSPNTLSLLSINFPLGNTTAYNFKINGQLFLTGTGINNNTTLVKETFNIGSTTTTGVIVFSDGASTNTASSVLATGPSVTFICDGTAGVSGLDFVGNSSGTGFVVLQNGGALQVTLAGSTVRIGGLKSITGTTNKVQINSNALLAFGQLNDSETVNAQIFGTGGIQKEGTGTYTLTNSANSYTGGTTIVKGSLVLNGGSLAPTGPVTITTGGNLDITNAAFNPTSPLVTIGDLNGDNTATITLGSNTLVTGTTNSATFSGMISGTGGLRKQGAGTLLLNGTNNYTGKTALDGGTLEITSANSIGGSSEIDTIGDSILLLDNPMTIPQPIVLSAILTVKNVSPNDSTLSGDISGHGALIKDGSATLTLRGTNSYSLGTLINAGVLKGNTNSIQGDIDDEASLVFDQNISSGTFSGNIIGGGSVTIQNTGTVIFTGTNSYTGGTTIVSGATLQGDTNSLEGLITDNGTLIFDQKFDGIFEGAISGNGIIEKKSKGDLAFVFDQGTFTGQTNVRDGTLTLLSRLGGNVDVYGTSILQGGGTIVGNLHMHTGTLVSPYLAYYPGTATLTVQGDFIQDAGSLYFCTVDILGAHDLIAVGGTAQLHGDLFVDYLNNNFILGQPPIPILTAAGGRAGVFANVNTNNPALVKPLLIYKPTEVLLSWVTDISIAAITPNQMNVAAQLDCITNPTTDQLLILNSIVNLTDPQARRALDSLAGEQYTYITPMNRYCNQRLNKRIFSNVQEVTEPCWCRCECDVIQPWFEVEKGAPSALGDKNAPSMFGDTLDLTLGAHVPFSKSFILGGCVNYDYNEMHFHDSGKAKWNTWQVAAYSILQQRLGYLFIDGIAASSFGDFKRKIQFGLVDRVALGKPKTHQGYLYTEIGMNFCCCNVLVQPFFGGEYAYYKEKKFSETGADSVNLTVEAKTTHTVDSYLGTHLTTMIGPCVTLRGDLAWHHSYGNQRFDSLNSFAFCNEFDVKGSKIGEDAAEASLSISALFCNRFSLSAEVSGERWYGWGAYSIDFGISTWW